jgi:CheY-like chemotaxis protein
MSPAMAQRLEHKRRVLLVIDDHDDSRELLAMLLRSTGAVVREARDGNEGLERANADAPAAVFCDLLMPGMDGYAFMDRLLRSPNLRFIPVVAVSILGSDRDFLNTCLAGFAGHIVKPVTREAVGAQLLRLFGRESE